MAEQERLPRELIERSKFERPKSWMPPQTLPDPNPEPGYDFRWIRVSVLSQLDPTNVSSKFREGWEPVKASDHPEIQLLKADTNQFKDSIEIGGLILCKTPSEFVEQRNAWVQKQTDGQMASVDSNLMRENDPRMPLFSERRSQIKFGKGSA